MTTEEHKARHRELHKALDELVADWIMHTEQRPSQGTILQLMQWSAAQSDNPTPERG